MRRLLQLQSPAVGHRVALHSLLALLSLRAASSAAPHLPPCVNAAASPDAAAALTSPTPPAAASSSLTNSYAGERTVAAAHPTTAGCHAPSPPRTATAKPRKSKPRTAKGSSGVKSGDSEGLGAHAGASSSTVTECPAVDVPTAAMTTAAQRDVRTIPSAYTSFRDAVPLQTFRHTYESIEVGQSNEQVTVRVGGRVISVRHMGRILFLTIRSAGHQLQVIRRVGDDCTDAELKALKERLRVGDIIGAEGHPGRTKKGELSLYSSRLDILTPYVCTDQTVCPDLKGFLPLSDTDVKYRYRFVDLMTSPTALEHFRKRHAIIKALRDYLDARDFIEVETPMLHTVASGANAKPFITHHNANDANLFLRVAPELHLKQCVVGGMDRVYEIGRVFRNEDADRSHNPEFTSCEFYAAYHTYEDLIPMTEDILRTMARTANGHTRIRVQSCANHGEEVELDLSQPFRRVSVYDEIQSVAQVELPPPTELNTPRGLAYMAAIMLRFNVPLPPVRTAAKMFDKLIDFFITDRVVEPTFVMDHPLCMSPLAKEHRDRPGLSERFELFINGTEYCNAYSELNDPQEQFNRFQQQLVDKRTGDEEAMSLDETFLKALQVGLPPTAGWGMGIDRVAMLLNGSATIREEILFPLLRQDTASHDAKRRRKTAGFFGMNQQMTFFCLNALEEEMVKRGAPQDSFEKVRELRRCILTLDKQCSALVDDLTRSEGGRAWRFDPTLAILRLFCGRN